MNKHKLPGQSMQDMLKMYGHLAVTVYSVKKSGKEKLFRLVKKNQIVNDGRLAILECLAQLAGNPGTLGHPDWNQLWSLSAGTDPTPALATQTALLSPIWTGQLALLTERAYTPALYEITVLKELPVGQATGAILAEAGIFTRGQFDDPTAAGVASWELIPDRRLYARQTHAAFEKGPNMLVTYEWHLGLTVQASP